jgi:hypothetical protein
MAGARGGEGGGRQKSEVKKKKEIENYALLGQKSLVLIKKTLIFPSCNKEMPIFH